MANVARQGPQMPLFVIDEEDGHSRADSSGGGLDQGREPARRHEMCRLQEVNGDLAPRVGRGRVHRLRAGRPSKGATSVICSTSSTKRCG